MTRAQLEEVSAVLLRCQDSDAMAGLLQGFSPSDRGHVSAHIVDVWNAETKERDAYVPLLLQLSTAFAKCRDYDRAIPLTELLISHARATSNQELLPPVLGTAGLLLMESGKLGVARRVIEEALAIATLTGDTYCEIRCMMNLAMISSREGNKVASLARFREALRTAKAAGETRGTELAEKSMVVTANEVLCEFVSLSGEKLTDALTPYVKQGAIESIIAHIPDFVKALVESRQDTSHLPAVFNFTAVLGQLLVREEQALLASSVFEHGGDIARLLGREREAVECLLNEGAAFVLAGEDSRAHRTFDRCLAEAQRADLPFVVGACLVSRAGNHLNHGRLKEAKGDYEQAILIAKKARLNDLEEVAKDGILRLADAIPIDPEVSKISSEADPSAVPPIELPFEQEDCSLEALVETFLLRDYESSCALAVALLGRLESYDDLHKTVQLFLIAMQRMAQPLKFSGFVKEYGQRWLRVFENREWEGALLRLTLGEATVNQVLDLAYDAHRRCQVLYYAGARLLTRRQLPEARTTLRQAVAIGVQSFEFRLAEAELAFLDKPAFAPDLLAAAIDAAETCFKEGRSEEGLAAASRARELLQQQGTEVRHDDVCIWNVIGSLHRQVGNYAEAEKAWQKAVEVTRQVNGEEHHTVGAILNNLAGLFESIGSLDDAESYYRRSVGILRKSGKPMEPYLAVTLANVAGLLGARGDIAGAERMYHEVLELQRRTEGDDSTAFCTTLHNLADLYRQMGLHVRAEPLYREAMRIWEAAGGGATGEMAVALNGLGALYLETGNYAAAEPLMRRALDASRRTRGERHRQVASCLNNLAHCLAFRGDYIGALDLLRQVIEIEDRMLADVFSFTSERQRMIYLRTLRSTFSLLLSLVLRHLNGSQVAQRVALDLVVRRKGLGTEALAAQRDALLSGRHPELLSPLQELRDLRSQIARCALAGPGPEGRQRHEQFLAGLIARRERIEAALCARIPEMRLQKQLQTVDLAALTRAVPAGTAVVEFVRWHAFNFNAVRTHGDPGWLQPRYLACVLVPEQTDRVEMIDLGEADHIDKMIADFRAAMSRVPPDCQGRALGVVAIESPGAASPSDGTRLRATIFDPLLSALENRRRLLIAPDGDICLLPLEALPNADGRRLIDIYDISYLSCARDVLRFQTKPTGHATTPLVIADPNFDLEAGIAENFGAPCDGRIWSAIGTPERRSFEVLSGLARLQPAGRLPATLYEGEVISVLLRGSRLWTGDAALEGRLRKECNSPRILHIATHGLFLEGEAGNAGATIGDLGDVCWQGGGVEGQPFSVELGNPLLRSCLILAGFNTWLRKGQSVTEAEDGVLTAEDVTCLNLLDTELVVLSACETGLGEVQLGEGIFGLRRAFVLAGTKTLVMSLWKVPDHQTQELMVGFYSRILAGESRAKAMRQAQLELKARYAHPFYWGAFICQGEPGHLPLDPEA